MKETSKKDTPTGHLLCRFYLRDSFLGFARLVPSMRHGNVKISTDISKNKPYKCSSKVSRARARDSSEARRESLDALALLFLFGRRAAATAVFFPRDPVAKNGHPARNQ